jgi:hypothetical protein
VDLGRSIDADADRHIIRSQDTRPFLVDENGVGANAATDAAACPLFDADQFLLEGHEAMLGKQKGLTAMKDQ